MDSIGAEVGNKMRSAIRAKLLELKCYVDDELPDYIMVMVANKRSKSQMNEDLNLFLSTKTTLFVDWLHIVLKKLKEVTVTNPEVYKKVDKQKSGTLDIKVKKEKKSKRFNTDIKSEVADIDHKTSLTDNLLITPHRLTDQRKIILNNGDNFDNPILSDPNHSNVNILKEKVSSVKSRLGLLVESDEESGNVSIEERSEIEKPSLCNNRTIKLHTNELELNVTEQIKHLPSLNESERDEISTTLKHTKTPEKRKHTPITFEKDEPPAKKLSILERLGKRTADLPRNSRNISEFRKEENRIDYFKQKDRDQERGNEEEERRGRVDRNHRNKRKRSRSPSLSRDKTNVTRRENFRTSRNETRRNTVKTVLSRLGVMSTIHVLHRDIDEPDIENELKTREVRSMVQVKPRVIPPNAPQPNKNLLLKAVAEAHRSVAQSIKVGTSKLDISPRKNKSNEGIDEPQLWTRKLLHSEKTKLRNIILSQVSHSRDACDDITGDVYVPKPLHKTPKEAPKYVPSSKYEVEELLNEDIEKQQIVVTVGNKKLVGDEENNTIQDKPPLRKSAKLRLQERKSPSPIRFENMSTKISTKFQLSDKLPAIRQPLSIKNKERCKYWPSCRQNDNCEFVHPNTNCELFPNCKFGDKCLFLHPPCKFGTSCTKKDCPYNHVAVPKSATSRGTLTHLSNKVVSQQDCKYFPNCTNGNCPFYHPKLCKFGKYCKNPADCTFSHMSPINTSNLTWRSKI